MYISIIVPNYNGISIIKECLRALLAQTLNHNEYEIIIVDDCSTDESRIYLLDISKQYSIVKTIFHVHNKGPSAARNSGIKVALGDIIIFVDNDIVVHANFIETHKMLHEKFNKEHIAVVSNLSYAAERIDERNFARFLNSRYIGNRSISDQNRLNLENLPHQCFGGGISSVRRDDIIAAGLFDENILGYGAEDQKMGLMLHRAGTRIIFAEAARALHYDTLSLKRYKLKILEMYQGGYRFLLDMDPSYFEGTIGTYLMPTAWRTDTIIRIIAKLSLELVLNPVFLFIVERWLMFTDKIGCLYFEPLYKLLLAGWIFRAVRSNERDVRLVSYGNK